MFIFLLIRTVARQEALATLAQYGDDGFAVRLNNKGEPRHIGSRSRSIRVMVFLARVRAFDTRAWPPYSGYDL